MYTKVDEKGKMLIVFLYVDDLIFNDDFDIEEFKVVMESEFEMIDLGLTNFLWVLKFSNLKVVFLYHHESMQVKF